MKRSERYLSYGLVMTGLLAVGYAVGHNNAAPEPAMQVCGEATAKPGDYIKGLAEEAAVDAGRSVSGETAAQIGSVFMREIEQRTGNSQLQPGTVVELCFGQGQNGGIQLKVPFVPGAPASTQQ